MNTIRKNNRFTLLFRSVAALCMAAIVATFAVPGLLDVAFANTPMLTLGAINGNAVTLTVQGDAYSQVSLGYYGGYSSATPTWLGTIGMTDASGNFSTTISTTLYNIPVNGSVFVSVNGQYSPAVYWPIQNGAIVGYGNGYTYNYGNTYYGQPSYTYPTQTPYQYYDSSVVNPSYNNNYYGYNNYNNAAATYGSVVVPPVYGTSYSYNYSNPANYTSNYYVPQYTYSTPVSVSRSYVSLSVGQLASVFLSGGSNNNAYYVSSYDSSMITPTVNGSSLTILAVRSGSTNLSVCSYGNSSCANISVTVAVPASYPAMIMNQYPYYMAGSYPWWYPSQWFGSRW
jgi:hypothetical protein